MSHKMLYVIGDVEATYRVFADVVIDHIRDDVPEIEVIRVVHPETEWHTFKDKDFEVIVFSYYLGLSVGNAFKHITPFRRRFKNATIFVAAGSDVLSLQEAIERGADGFLPMGEYTECVRILLDAFQQD